MNEIIAKLKVIASGPGWRAREKLEAYIKELESRKGAILSRVGGECPYHGNNPCTCVIGHEATVKGEYIPQQRTRQQNNALYLFFQKVADACVARGITMRKIFEKTESFDVPPTKYSIHDLWIYFQERMYGTKRTRDLKKLEQINKIHEVMMKNLGETFEIDYIDFPSDGEDLAPLKSKKYNE